MDFEFFSKSSLEVGSILHQPLFLFFWLEALDKLEALDSLENLEVLENLSIFLKPFYFCLLLIISFQSPLLEVFVSGLPFCC